MTENRQYAATPLTFSVLYSTLVTPVVNSPPAEVFRDTVTGGEDTTASTSGFLHQTATLLVAVITAVMSCGQ